MRLPSVVGFLAPSKSERDSVRPERRFVTLAAPLLWLGSLTGSFPLSKLRSCPRDPERDPHRMNSVALPPEPGTGDSARHLQRFALNGFKTFLSLVWIGAIVFVNVLNTPVNTSMKFGVSTMSYLYQLIIVFETIAYISGWVMVCRSKRMQEHLAALDELDDSIRSTGTTTRSVLAQVIVIMLIQPVLDICILMDHNDRNNTGSIVLMVVMCFHFKVHSRFYLFMSCLSVAHLTDKLKETNEHLKEVVSTCDTAALKDIRKLIMKIRNACDQSQEVFQVAVACTFLYNAFANVCWTVQFYYLSQQDVFDVTQMALVIGTVLVAHMVFGTTVSTAHTCSKVAKDTELLLLQQGDAEDQFSMTVSDLRTDLRHHQVSFTCFGLFVLNKKDWLTQYQFLMTTVVVGIQFAQIDLKQNKEM